MFRKVVTALLSLLLLAGCAVVDVSMTETALPPSQEGNEYSPYFCFGGLLTREFLSEMNDSKHAKSGEYMALPLYLAFTSRVGILVTSPVSARSEVTAKAYMSPVLNLGAKLGYKQVLWQGSAPAPSGESPVRSCLALQPALNVMVPLEMDDEELETGGRQLLAGAECLLMYSRYRNVESITTYGLRLGWQKEWGYKSGDLTLREDIPCLSLAANRSFPSRNGMALIPGIGVTVQPDEAGLPVLLPFFNLGLTFPQ